MSKISIGCRNDTSIDIACTWGEGADVSATIRFNLNILDQYTQKEGGFLPLDLTADEAIEIGMRFTQAGAKAKKITEQYHKEQRKH